MSHRRLTSVRLDEELVEAMARLRERDGLRLSEQVRRGLRRFLEAEGVIEKADVLGQHLNRHEHTG
jgi:Arc/MetJ-type ribon-helix-helix transcriptional regulator